MDHLARSSTSNYLLSHCILLNNAFHNGTSGHAYEIVQSHAMDVSDDEDPLALRPRTRSHNRARPGQPSRSETETTRTDVPLVEVVPTSDSEEAHEDMILAKGWEEYLTNPSGPQTNADRAPLLLESDVSLKSTAGTSQSGE